MRYFLNIWRNRSKKRVTGINSLKKEMKTRKERLLNNAVFRWLWILAFFIDYGLQVFIKIRVALLKERLIVSDRIFYDSVIDQAVNLGQKREWLINNLETFWMRIIFPSPDVVIYVDCPENIAFSRTDDNLDVEYLEERRKLYLMLADKYGWFKVDGTLSVEEVASRVKEPVFRKMAINI